MLSTNKKKKQEKKNKKKWTRVFLIDKWIIQQMLKSCCAGMTITHTHYTVIHLLPSFLVGWLVVVVVVGVRFKKCYRRMQRRRWIHAAGLDDDDTQPSLYLYIKNFVHFLKKKYFFWIIFDLNWIFRPSTDFIWKIFWLFTFTQRVSLYSDGYFFKRMLIDAILIGYITCKLKKIFKKKKAAYRLSNLGKKNSPIWVS